jgi:hypothetical protein
VVSETSNVLALAAMMAGCCWLFGWLAGCFLCNQGGHWQLAFELLVLFFADFSEKLFVKFVSRCSQVTLLHVSADRRPCTARDTQTPNTQTPNTQTHNLLD